MSILNVSEKESCACFSWVQWKGFFKFVFADVEKGKEVKCQNTQRTILALSASCLVSFNSFSFLYIIFRNLCHGSCQLFF